MCGKMAIALLQRNLIAFQVAITKQSSNHFKGIGYILIITALFMLKIYCKNTNAEIEKQPLKYGVLNTDV